MADIIIGMVGCSLVLAYLAKSFENDEGYLYKFIFIVASLLMLLTANQTMVQYAGLSSASINTTLTNLISNSSGLLIDYTLLIFITMTVLFFLIKILTEIIGNLNKKKHPQPIKPGGA